VLRIDEKNTKEYNVFNCCGLILTSNHKTAGIYLPADDRRYYVPWGRIRYVQLGDVGGDVAIAAVIA
jgi:hypothetical protein